MVWLRYLLEFLECRQDAVTLACDSKSAVHLMKSVAVHSKSKDLCRDLPLLRDWTTDGEISPQHIAGEKQPADFLTKSLSTEAFKRCQVAIGLATKLQASSEQSTFASPQTVPVAVNHATVQTDRSRCDCASLQILREFLSGASRKGACCHVRLNEEISEQSNN